MQDVLGIVGLVVALAVIGGIPLGIMTVLSRKEAARMERLLDWARAHGLRGAPAPAVSLPHQRSISVELDGGVLTVGTSSGRADTFYTFAFRPPGRVGRGSFWLQRATFGAGGERVTGDPLFDGQFLVTARGDEWREHLVPEVVSKLLVRSSDVFSASAGDGVFTLMLAGTGLGTAEWDYAVDVLRTWRRNVEGSSYRA